MTTPLTGPAGPGNVERVAAERQASTVRYAPGEAVLFCHWGLPLTSPKADRARAVVVSSVAHYACEVVTIDVELGGVEHRYRVDAARVRSV
ncbi:MAG: hypothetical protein DWQ20_00910 [Actinobacteria bacterium]|nr:MAG: hypothetical protein DWQ20_00910 [Actinomycetota bacterium]